MILTYTDSGWYRNFFHGIVNDLWRAAMTPEMTRTEADFVRSQLHLPAGAAILDVPCGNARLALELAGHGYRLSGVDISAESIAEAQEAAKARELSLDLRAGDMRDLPRDERFDGAYCWGNSLGYIDDQGTADFFLAVQQSLKPGGRFLLHSNMIAEGFWPSYHESLSMPVGDIEFAVHHTYDAFTSRLNTMYVCKRAGVETRQPGSQRIFACREVCLLLEQAGLPVKQVLGDLTDEPFGVGSHHAIFVADKV